MIVEVSGARIEFVEEPHGYWLLGEGDKRIQQIPGVSHILRAMGETGAWMPAAKYLERGRLVHAVCEMIDREEITADAAFEQYPQVALPVAAWVAFKRENKVRVLAIEEVVFDPDLFICGKLDITFTMRGRDRPILCDRKNGAKAPWHVLQLAAYYKARGRGEYDVADIYFKPNGRYSWAPLTEGQRDYNVDRWCNIAQRYREVA